MCFRLVGAVLLLQRSRVCALHVRDGRSAFVGARFCVVLLADGLALDLSEECSRELGLWFHVLVVMTTCAGIEWARIHWWAYAGPATGSAALCENVEVRNAEEKGIGWEAVLAGMEMHTAVRLGIRVSRWRKGALGQKCRETGDAKMMKRNDLPLRI